MRRLDFTALAVVLALSPLAVACGSGGGETPPTEKAPGPSGQPSVAKGESPEPGARSGKDHSAERQKAGSDPSARDSTSGKSAGGEDRPHYDPNLPDGPGNDKPPPPGSPAERFEQACEKDPHLCD